MHIPARAPEEELLICCARSDADAETAQRILALLKNGVDWTLFIPLAQHHGMIPLAYRRLRSLVPEALPDPPVKSLTKLFLGVAARNIQLTKELLRILEMFQEQAIQAVPLKGPALAVAAFGAVHCREFGDLDILVRPPGYPGAAAGREQRQKTLRSHRLSRRVRFGQHTRGRLSAIGARVSIYPGRR
jgi:hypothetical protein